MEYQSGQVVYSKSGHDKGDTLMVLFVEGAYVYLADKLAEGAYVLDADIAKAIKKYKKLAET